MGLFSINYLVELRNSMNIGKHSAHADTNSLLWNEFDFPIKSLT